MDRRRKLIIGAGIAGVLAAVVLVVIQRRAASARRTPEWTDPEQPPEGLGGLGQAIGLPTAGASWSAARPGDPGMRGGGRVMRTYAATLADDPESVVR